MSTCNCPGCYGRRGWEAPRITAALGKLTTPQGQDIISLDAPVPQPPHGPSESLTDDLVGDLVGALAMLREPQCGSVQITDDQIKDRACNIVQSLIGNYKIERLP